MLTLEHFVASFSLALLLVLLGSYLTSTTGTPQSWDGQTGDGYITLSHLTPSLLILLSLIWGLVTASLTLGWNHLEHQALAIIQKDMKKKLPQLELTHRQTEDDIPIELLIDTQNQEIIINEEA
jgi:ABC-type arginine transport system permease subunit